MKKIDKTDTLLKILSERRFTVDYFQREYRWGRKQIEQMLSDLQNTFEEYYDAHDARIDVDGYGFYYMGCIICTGGSMSKIIDGQQRLTSLTLLLIYLKNLQKELGIPEDDQVKLDSMIYAAHYGIKSYNIDVPERAKCIQWLLEGEGNYVPDNESAQNMLDRYRDIADCFPDELKGEPLLFFIDWLIHKVLLLEIDTPSEDEAHTIFLTMNDRGLSLNSAEMMKAYVIQHVAESDRVEVNHQWQDNINRIKNASSYNSSGTVNTEDVEFISMWLRAKYAETLREGKRGAKDEDYELLGDKFHTWVRNNAIEKMSLARPKDYKSLIMTEMTQITNLYLRLKQFGSVLTPEYEEVFYNANRDLTYQIMLVLSAVKNDDSDDVVKKKIQLTAKFVDDFASIRIFNSRRVNWNTNKYFLFKIMRDIRNQDCKTIGMVYIRALRQMDANLDGITEFRLDQFSGRYMLHLLARFTSYVNVLMGNPSHFDEYIDRKRQGNTYDIEHILPNKYEDYSDDFGDYKDFQLSRQYIGNLILLTRDKNRSYQDMKYGEKMQHYASDNILAQALNPITYHNHPQFLSNVAQRYGFRPIEHFQKQSIAERAEIYLQMANDIWNPADIKNLAGGWSDEEEKAFIGIIKGQEFTVGYADRSWPDALKYGFLSANAGRSGRSLYNVQVGDTVFCHIAGSGFVGIGECLATAVPMATFSVDVNNAQTPIAQAPWISEDAKNMLDPDKEIFIRVQWKNYVADPADGYWERGMKSVPLVAYTLTDKTTYRKVKEHFGYQENTSEQNA